MHASPCSEPCEGPAPPALGWFLAVTFLNGLVVEVGRKMRAPSDEEPGVETYTAGQSFFEPDGSTHLFAENANPSEPAKILAVFVHREGAQLTVFH